MKKTNTAPRTFFLAAILTFIQGTAHTATDLVGTEQVDCIPDGEWTELSWENSIGGEGMPVDGELVSGSGDVVELDPWSDDSLGAPSDMSQDGSTVSGTVSVGNAAGELSGPSGDAQNVGTEGDCIGVTLGFKIRYPITVTTKKTTKTIEGGTVTTTKTHKVWGYRTLRMNPVKEICPC